MAKPDVLVLDLFGTIVFFDADRIPRRDFGGRMVPQTIGGLDEWLAEFLPQSDAAGFLAELWRVSRAMLEERKAGHLEFPSALRFERTLAALGLDASKARREAGQLSARHMDSLARAVRCPDDRADLLQRLAATHRLALLSNFDCGLTARRVLREAGLDGYFESIVVSADEGLRKPSPELFARCTATMGVDSSRCLFVGDTYEEDILGAASAGMPAVWIQPDASVAAAPALATIADLAQLPDWLAAEAGA